MRLSIIMILSLWVSAAESYLVNIFEDSDSSSKSGECDSKGYLCSGESCCVPLRCVRWSGAGICDQTLPPEAMTTTTTTTNTNTTTPLPVYLIPAEIATPPAPYQMIPGRITTTLVPFQIMSAQTTTTPALF